MEVILIYISFILLAVVVAISVFVTERRIRATRGVLLDLDEAYGKDSIEIIRFRLQFENESREFRKRIEALGALLTSPPPVPEEDDPMDVLNKTIKEANALTEMQISAWNERYNPVGGDIER